jgi:arylsulfatase A-like enzyme
VLDLARAAATAEFNGRWDLLVAGTPASMLRLKGASIVPAPAADPRVALRRRPHVALKWKGVEPRVAVVDLEPSREAAPATVWLNDTEVGRVAPTPGRSRHLIRLPVAAQRRRQNVLRFDFETPETPGRQGPPAPAHLYTLAVGRDSDPALHDLVAAGAPPPLSLASGEGGPALVQAAPGAIRYAIRVPARGELRFRPALHPAARQAGARASLRVTLEEKEGVESEIWRATLQSDGPDPVEVRLPLPVRPGAVVRLSLHAHGERYPWVVWSQPRVLGDSACDPLAPQTPESDEDDRTAPLRRAVEGSSVLFVILDAAGARHLGCYGYPRATTPEIDRIAAEGVLFERAYTTAAYTRSAMATVWTSLYHDQHHAGLRYDAPLPDGVFTLARLLTAGGIRAAGFVANPSAGGAFGLDQGFSEFQGVYGRSLPSAEQLRRTVTAWLEGRKQGGRFFVYLHFREPHSPYDPPAPFDTRFGPDAPLPREARGGAFLRDVNDQRRTMSPLELDHLVRLYDGNLAYADSQLGELRRSLEAMGLWEHLTVIVSADHGEAFGEHGFVGHNKQLYEETARIPLILRFPKGAGPAGRRVSSLVDLADLAPTVADVFGLLGKGESGRFLGRSLLAVAAGVPGKSGTVGRTAHDDGVYAVTDGRFKLLHASGTGADELYDLEADPSERANLAGGEPILAAYYRQALHRRQLLAVPAAGSPVREPTPEERDTLRALGYLN